jgi:hypothetical protein
LSCDDVELTSALVPAPSISDPGLAHGLEPFSWMVPILDGSQTLVLIPRISTYARTLNSQDIPYPLHTLRVGRALPEGAGRRRWSFPGSMGRARTGLIDRCRGCIARFLSRPMLGARQAVASVPTSVWDGIWCFVLTASRRLTGSGSDSTREGYVTYVIIDSLNCRMDFDTGTT